MPNKAIHLRFCVLVIKGKASFINLMYLSIYLPSPPPKQFWIQSLSFAETIIKQNKEPSQPYYLRIAGKSIMRFIPFQRVLALCEIALSKFWTWLSSLEMDTVTHCTSSTTSLFDCQIWLGRWRIYIWWCFKTYIPIKTRILVFQRVKYTHTYLRFCQTSNPASQRSPRRVEPSLFKK